MPTRGNAEMPPIDDTWTMCGTSAYPRERRDAADRRHLDDVPAPLLAQVRQGSLGDPERTEQVGLDLAPRLVLRELLDHPEVPVTGVVDDDVESAEVVVCLRHGREVGVTIGDVERDRQQAGAVLLHQVVETGDVAGGRSDLVAALEGGDGPLAAETTRRTGDEPGLAHLTPQV